MALRSDGTVIIDTRMDTRGFNSGVNSMQKKVGGLSTSIKKLGAVIASAFAIKAIVDFGKKSIELGSDLEEVQNVVHVVFKSMEEDVNAFAKSASENFGLSETMAKRFVGTFGAMSKSFGFDESEAFKMSTTLAGLAGDIASFYNITQDEAYTKLKSVFTGETETLKDLGIVMTQNALDAYAMAKGIGKTTKSMTEQEKVALRYMFVIEQLKNANGDFARTSDSWANQMRLLKLNVESIMATLGQALINFFTPVIKVINTLLSKLATLASAFKSFSEMIMGKKSSENKGVVKNAVNELGGLEESYDDVADASKKAEKANKKYLSGLDEIRTFTSENSSANSLPVGSISSDTIDFDEVAEEGEKKINPLLESIINRLKELGNLFKKGFFDGLGDFKSRLETIKNGLKSIKDSLIDIFTDPKVIASANRYLDSLAYALGQIAGSIVSIGITIGANLVGGMSKYLEQNKNRIKDYLVSMFDIGTEFNEIIGETFSSIAYIFEAFASENGQNLTSNIIGIFADSFMGITELAGKLGVDLLNIITKPIIENKEKFRTALEGLLGVLAEVAGSIKTTIDETFDKLNEVYDLHIAPFFDSVADGLSELVGAFLSFWNEYVQPILQSWGEDFDSFLSEHLQPFFNNAIELLGSFADLLKALWEEILVPFLGWIINTILPTVLPIIQAIWDAFKKAFDDFTDILNDITLVFKGVIDLLTALIKGDWQGVWDACLDIVKNVFNLIADTIKYIFDGIVEVFNIFFETILSIVGVALDTLWGTIKTVFNIIKEGVVGAFTWLVENIGNCLTDIKGIWDDAWGKLLQTVSDIWDNITDKIKKAIDVIMGLVEKVKNAFKEVKEGISNLGSGSSNTKYYGGGAGVSFKVPSINIPKLASGSVIPPNAPFMAMLGDQKHGTNIEAPLDTIKQAVKEVVGNQNVSGDVHVSAVVDGRELFELVLDKARLMQASTGQNVLVTL